MRRGTGVREGRHGMSNTSILVVCPYFGSEHPGRLQMNCEAGRLHFPDKRARLDYIFSHCADLQGCQECSLHRMMDEAYGRMTPDEIRQTVYAIKHPGRPRKGENDENAAKTGAERAKKIGENSVQNRAKLDTGRIWAKFGHSGG